MVARLCYWRIVFFLAVDGVWKSGRKIDATGWGQGVVWGLETSKAYFSRYGSAMSYLVGRAWEIEPFNGAPWEKEARFTCAMRYFGKINLSRFANFYEFYQEIVRC